MAALAIVVAATAGCTQAPVLTNTATNAARAPSDSTSGSPTDSTTPVTASPRASTSGVSLSPPPTNPAPAPPAISDACTPAALSIAALRGSGAAGHQFASLQFRNKSTASCSLTGFPGVVLLKAGAQLGQPATRSAKPASKVRLLPGRSASATLTNDSTCNAPNSDSVQVIAPNRTEKVVLQLSLRGCPLTIDPVAAS